MKFVKKTNTKFHLISQGKCKKMVKWRREASRGRMEKGWRKNVGKWA